MSTSRRQFLAACSGLGLGGTLFPGALWSSLQASGQERVTLAMVREASALAGLSLSEEEQRGMIGTLNRIRRTVHELHESPADNSAPSPLHFDPRVPGHPIDVKDRPFRPSSPQRQQRPSNLEEVAFWPITHLADLVRRGEVSALELTDMYLARLERHNGVLNCVVNLTADRARTQARVLDRELAAGQYRGVLHGIPWGVKDIVAVDGYPTTWGAAPFADRVIEVDATVVERLDAAGAVLVAKLTTGEMAFGDQWYGGRTNNPWNPEQGSSGSSAGSGAATAAGLVGFAIGSDTGGSILSPAIRCGVVGLRPTFGRVSRHGVMAAGWTLDKIGPMCRTVEDCAIVMDAIAGPDDKDLAVREGVPLGWDAGESARGLRVGVVRGILDAESDTAVKANGQLAIDALRSAGLEIRNIEVPESNLTYFIEFTERAAGFETFVQRGEDKGLRRQQHARELRAYHLVTAVDYLQANRERQRLMVEYAKASAGLDVVIAGRETLDSATSLNPLLSMTGHPTVALPTGFRDDGTPTGLTVAGRLYDEAGLMVVARVIERAVGIGDRRPEGFLPG